MEIKSKIFHQMYVYFDTPNYQKLKALRSPKDLLIIHCPNYQLPIIYAQSEAKLFLQEIILKV